MAASSWLPTRRATSPAPSSRSTAATWPNSRRGFESARKRAFEALDRLRDEQERGATSRRQQPLRIASQDLEIRVALDCHRHVTPGSKRRDRPRPLRDAACSPRNLSTETFHGVSKREPNDG